MKVTFIHSDEGDWIAMYIDGKKVREGHSISEEDVVRELGIEIESRRVVVDPYKPQDDYFPWELAHDIA